MRKHLVRIVALALALLMCLSLLPVSALAMDGNWAGNPWAGYDPLICLESDDGQHHFIEINSAEYLCWAGDCDPAAEDPHRFYKACAYCGMSAQPLYDLAYEQVQQELFAMRASGTEPTIEQLEEMDRRCTSYLYEMEGHFFGAREGQAPTCTMDGWTPYRECEFCGEIEDYQELSATGHSFGETVVLVEPTCTQDGSGKHVCQSCGLEEYETIPALGHSYGEFTVTLEPTCTQDGSKERVCAVCGEKDVQVIPAAHKYGDFVVTKEPTCTEEGSKERVCTVCGEKDVQLIPPAHTFGEYAVTQEPTCTLAGTEERVCLLCGATESRELPPAHKYDESHQCIFCGVDQPYEQWQENVNEKAEEAAEESDGEPSALRSAGEKDESAEEEEPREIEGVTVSGEEAPTFEAGAGEVPLEGGHSDTQSVFIGETLRAVPAGSADDYSYQWYSATAKNSGESAISGATSQVFGVSDTNLLGEYVFCIATPKDGSTHAIRSEAYHVYEVIYFNLRIEGKGTVTVIHTDSISGTETTDVYDHTASDDVTSYQIDCVTEDRFSITMDPYPNDGEVNSYVVRSVNNVEIVSPTPVTRTLTATHSGTHKKTYSIKFDLPRNYAENGPTEDEDIAIEQQGTARDAFYQLLESESARLHVDKSVIKWYGDPYPEFKYVTPVWTSNPTALTSTQVQGIDFYVRLEYPNGTAADKDNYDFYVYHYNSNNWDGPIPDGDVSLEDSYIRVHYNNFSPFTVLAIPKTDLTEIVTEGGTVLRNGTSLGTGTHTDYVGSIGAEIAYTVTPDVGYAIKNVSFSGDPGRLSNPSVGKYVLRPETAGTITFTFMKVTAIPEEADQATKNSLETFLKSEGLENSQRLAEKVTPKWEDGTTLTQEEINETGGIAVELTYPNEQVRLYRNDYVIQVFQQTGVTWKEITDDVTLTDTGIRLTTTDFAPFGVVATVKNVTIEFQVGDMIELTMPAINGKAVKLPDGSPYTGTKAFAGWNTDPGFTGVTYTAGESYTPHSGSSPTVRLYAVMVTAVTVSFEPGDGTGSMAPQKVAQGVDTDLDRVNSKELYRDGYVFSNWKLKNGVKTFEDGGIINTTADVTLVAQWKAGTAPSAPSDLAEGRSILNYPNSLLDNQMGVISGVSSSMEIYTGHGNWTSITDSTYLVEEPGEYDIRFKANTTMNIPASEYATVKVHEYYTLASEPIKQSETEYLYNVKLYEEYANGTVEEKHQTELKEDVMFFLEYPAGKTYENYAFTLYHMPDKTPVEIEELNVGIVGSYDYFSDFLLEIEDRIKGTVVLDDYIPVAGDTIKAQATFEKPYETDTPQYQWYRIGEDGKPEPIFGATSSSYKVTSDDLKYELFCAATSKEHPKKGIVTSDTTYVVDTYYVRDKILPGILGYIEGVTAGMEYSTNGGLTWQRVPSSMVYGDNLNCFLVYSEGTYLFRDKDETNSYYWAEEYVDDFYLIALRSEGNEATYTVTISPAATTSGAVQVYSEPGYEYAWRIKPGTAVSLRVVASNSSYYVFYRAEESSSWSNAFKSSATISLGQVQKDYYIVVSISSSSTSPRTGDEAQLGLWSALCFASLTGVGSILHTQRKRKKTER